MSPDRFTRTALSMWGGLLVWGAAFLFVYVFTAVACERGFANREVLGIDVVTFASICAGLLAGTVILWIPRAVQGSADERSRQRGPQFISFIATASGGLAFVALVLLMLPPLLSAPVCQAQVATQAAS
jgi:hypothetical protein